MLIAVLVVVYAGQLAAADKRKTSRTKNRLGGPVVFVFDESV
jgi:hypothetical protein